MQNASGAAGRADQETRRHIAAPRTTITEATVLIECKGQCTIEHALELHNTLQNALERADPIEISFAGVTKADISFFQLLYSLHASCKQLGRELVLRDDMPESLAAQSKMTGTSTLNNA